MQAPRASSNRRKRYLVHPAFQWKIAGWLALDVFVVGLFMGALLYMLQERQIRHQVLDPFGERGTTVWLNFAFAATFALLTAGAFGIGSLMVSHRFVGPLHVIAAGLNKLAQGRLPNTRPLRRRDEFQDFYGIYENAMRALRAERRLELDDLDAVIESLDAAQRAAAAPDAPLDAALARLRKLRAQIETSLGARAQHASEPGPTHPDARPQPRPADPQAAGRNARDTR